jgi:hypothetical protein
LKIKKLVFHSSESEGKQQGRGEMPSSIDISSAVKKYSQKIDNLNPT